MAPRPQTRRLGEFGAAVTLYSGVLVTAFRAGSDSVHLSAGSLNVVNSDPGATPSVTWIGLPVP